MSFEGQRVVRELWLLLMVNILMSIIPIRESSRVRTHLQAWSFIFRESLSFLSVRRDLERLECCCCSCTQLHLVRIDYFVLFLWVEYVFLPQNHCILAFAMEFFLIVCCNAAWIRILNEPITTSSSFIPILVRIFSIFINKKNVH